MERGRALRDLDAGVPGSEVGPLRRRETQHATKNNKGNGGLENNRGDGVRSNVAEAPGGALQGFIAVLEYRELHEPLAFGHDKELGLGTSEDGIDIGVEIRSELVEPDFKRKRHRKLPRRIGSLSVRTVVDLQAARRSLRVSQARRDRRIQSL